MTGLEISNKTSLTLFWSSVIGAILSIVLGIAVGPKGIVAASGVGVALSGADFWKRTRTNAGLLLPGVMLGVHILFLLVAAVLAFFFLAPLPEASLRMPKLSQRYSDHNGLFQVRLPARWEFEPLNAEHEVGVRAHPSDRADYMGVAEVMVRVRILSKKQPGDTEFFQKMARTLAPSRSQKKRLFDFRCEPVVLLNGAPGLWSHLVLKRFWVPLYQTSLFGLQRGRFLCSVATSGIKSHDKLARVLCLGIMESIQMTENAEKSN
jgi:hypothetical protein